MLIIPDHSADSKLYYHYYCSLEVNYASGDGKHNNHNYVSDNTFYQNGNDDYSNNKFKIAYIYVK